MPRLNPAQQKLFARHVERAIETLREADRLLKGAVAEVVDGAVAALQQASATVTAEESNTLRFELTALPMRLVPYLENPFAQALAFNLFCQRTGQSHTQAAKTWEGGTSAVAARNLVFLPALYEALWEEGVVDKTRLVAIANRNLTDKGYLDVADLVRTRRKEDVDDRLMRLPPGYLQVGRRGPVEAMESAERHGWNARLREVEIPAELVVEAGSNTPQETVEIPSPAAAVATPSEAAQQALRAGLSGARISPEVAEALSLSPDPLVLAERFLTAHRKTGDVDPPVVTKTLFFAHAGPMQRLVSDDKLLLRHFRPVKTQKRGQLFYRLLEVIEEALLERLDRDEVATRGISETEAMVAIRKVIVDLNKDPNRYLQVPEEWLGEVTRRHLYFGSRTRKEGAAYKWYRKIGPKFFLGAHKTTDEVADRTARRAAKAAGEEE